MKKALWTKLHGLKPRGKPREKKQPKRVRKVSKTRAKQLARYRKLRMGYLCLNPTCVFCSMPAEDIHHRKGKAGELLLDTTLWSSVCRTCHTWIHNNPEAAYNLGLLDHHWNTPKK